MCSFAAGFFHFAFLSLGSQFRNKLHSTEKTFSEFFSHEKINALPNSTIFWELEIILKIELVQETLTKHYVRNSIES